MLNNALSVSALSLVKEKREREKTTKDKCQDCENSAVARTQQLLDGLLVYQIWTYGDDKLWCVEKNFRFIKQDLKSEEQAKAFVEKILKR
jgi:hypothetical protein